MFPEQKRTQQERSLFMQLLIGEILFQSLRQGLVFPLNGLRCSIKQFRKECRVARSVRGTSIQPDGPGQCRCQIVINSRRPNRTIHIHVQLQAGVFLIQVDLQIIDWGVRRGTGFFRSDDGEVLLFRQPVSCRVIYLLRQVGHDGFDNELRLRLERRLKAAG